MACTDIAVPREVMRHVVRVESSFNPYAIGVVGGRLARQPRSLPEALSTARMLEREGYNFSVGLAQVNRHNLAPQGLDSYEKAFDACPNLQAGSRILAECFSRSGKDWGKAFSCYYSGNFVTGFRHGYVQKVVASWRQASVAPAASAIPVVPAAAARSTPVTSRDALSPLVSRRIAEASQAPVPGPTPAVASRSATTEPELRFPAAALAPDTQFAGAGGRDAPVMLQPMAGPAPLPPASAPGEPAKGAATDSVADGAPGHAIRATHAAQAPQRDAAFVF